MFGLAPASARRRTISVWAFPPSPRITASSSAVQPSLLTWSLSIVGREQDFHRLGMAVMRGRDQRRATVAIGALEVGAGGERHLQDVVAAFRARIEERAVLDDCPWRSRRRPRRSEGARPRHDCRALRPAMRCGPRAVARLRRWRPRRAALSRQRRIAALGGGDQRLHRDCFANARLSSKSPASAAAISTPQMKRAAPGAALEIVRIVAATHAAAVASSSALLLLHRAGIEALGIVIAVDEFDHRDRRGIAVAEAGLEHAGIAALAVLVARDRARRRAS